MTSVTRALRWLVLVVLVAAGCSSGDDASPASIHVVSQNVLHGIACPPDSDGCDLPGRAALFAQQLDEGGCPELVGLQEANEAVLDALRPELGDACDGRYEVVFDGDDGVDREVVLTTLPVLGTERIRLAGPLRTALWVRVAADVGVVDFVTTHLASGSDDRPCDERLCPPPCDAAGSVNTCQAVQVLRFARRVAHEDGVVVVGGDLNARADEPAVVAVRRAGFEDTHLAAGNPECDARAGDQCTSGRADDSLRDLTDPSSRQQERIDYLFVGGSRSCETRRPTGLFNAAPADPPGAGGLVFPSDHTGVETTLSCATTEDQREAATSANVARRTTTTVRAEATVDQETIGEITEAFHLLFDGDVTDVEAKLAALEDGDALRAYFLESYEAQREIASRVRVRIDAMRLVDPRHAEVTYSLLLEGQPVLDHLEGGAVRVGRRWLVTRRTYCDVSTQGQEQIPAPCARP
jgi:endonuclease/exonuclease/phosphatase family metal-dependent hydrolase